MVNNNELTSDNEKIIDALISAVAELSSRLLALEEALNENG